MSADEEDTSNVVRLPLRQYVVPEDQLTDEQREARRRGAALSAWVDREVEKDRAAYDALSQEEKDAALARLLCSMLPVQAVIKGGKE